MDPQFRAESIQNPGFWQNKVLIESLVSDKIALQRRLEQSERVRERAMQLLAKYEPVTVQKGDPGLTFQFSNGFESTELVNSSFLGPSFPISQSIPIQQIVPQHDTSSIGQDQPRDLPPVTEPIPAGLAPPQPQENTTNQLQPKPKAQAQTQEPKSQSPQGRFKSIPLLTIKTASAGSANTLSPEIQSSQAQTSQTPQQQDNTLKSSSQSQQGKISAINRSKSSFVDSNETSSSGRLPGLYSTSSSNNPSSTKPATKTKSTSNFCLPNTETSSFTEPVQNSEPPSDESSVYATPEKISDYDDVSLNTQAASVDNVATFAPKDSTSNEKEPHNQKPAQQSATQPVGPPAAQPNVQSIAKFSSQDTPQPAGSHPGPQPAPSLQQDHQSADYNNNPIDQALTKLASLEFKPEPKPKPKPTAHGSRAASPSDSELSRLPSLEPEQPQTSNGAQKANTPQKRATESFESNESKKFKQETLKHFQQFDTVSKCLQVLHSSDYALSVSLGFNKDKKYKSILTLLDHIYYHFCLRNRVLLAAKKTDLSRGGICQYHCHTCAKVILKATVYPALDVSITLLDKNHECSYDDIGKKFKILWKAEPDVEQKLQLYQDFYSKNGLAKTKSLIYQYGLRKKSQSEISKQTTSFLERNKELSDELVKSVNYTSAHLTQLLSLYVLRITDKDVNDDVLKQFSSNQGLKFVYGTK